PLRDAILFFPELRLLWQILSSWTGTIGLRHRGHGSWFWPTAAFGWSTALHRGFGWRWPRRQAWSWALAGHDRTGGARAPGAGHGPLPRAGDPVLLRMAGPDGVGRKRARPWKRVEPVPMLLAVLRSEEHTSELQSRE